MASQLSSPFRLLVVPKESTLQSSVRHLTTSITSLSFPAHNDADEPVRTPKHSTRSALTYLFPASELYIVSPIHSFTRIITPARYTSTSRSACPVSPNRVIIHASSMLAPSFACTPVCVDMEHRTLSQAQSEVQPTITHSPTLCSRRTRIAVDVSNAGTQPQLMVIKHKCSDQRGSWSHTNQPPNNALAYPTVERHNTMPPSSNATDSHLQTTLQAGFHSAFFEYNDGSSLSSYFVTTAIAKAHSAIWPRFVAGLLAGLFVALGATFALVAAGGISADIRASNPAIPKLLTGITFPIALLLILLVAGDLFTGNCMTVGLGWFTGNITARQGANVLIVSFWSNLCGCLFWGYFLAYKTELFLSEPYNSWMLSVANSKLALDWGVVVLRAVGANILVCLAIFMASTSRQALGRFVIGWIPVLVFSVIGYEHVVADMAFVPIAMMYGGTVCGVRHYIGWNLVPATLGNVVGGLFVVGGFLSYLYVWKQRRIVSLTEWLRYNFVPTQSIGGILCETAHQFLNDLPVGDSRVGLVAAEKSTKRDISQPEQIE